MAAALLLTGCGEEPPPPPPEPKAGGHVPGTRQARTVARASEQPTRPAGAGAAEVIKAYYGHIRARDYAEAYALREPGEGAASEADFAANFDRYAEFNVTVGHATEPVRSGGWDYVEVPVHRYGRMKDGSPLASAGTVTLRRRAGGGEWRIFTKG